MRKIIFITILLSCFICNGQTKSEIKLIANIERQILDPKVSKLELFQENGWQGGYEKTIVYLKDDIPILIEKEEKVVIHEYLTNGTEEDQVTFITARFYITNWTKNDFIRVGKLQNEKVMPTDYVFEFNKSEIDKKIKEKTAHNNKSHVKQ